MNVLILSSLLKHCSRCRNDYEPPHLQEMSPRVLADCICKMSAFKRCASWMICTEWRLLLTLVISSETQFHQITSSPSRNTSFIAYDLFPPCWHDVFTVHTWSSSSLLQRSTDGGPAAVVWFLARFENNILTSAFFKIKYQCPLQ